MLERLQSGSLCQVDAVTAGGRTRHSAKYLAAIRLMGSLDFKTAAWAKSLCVLILLILSSGCMNLSRKIDVEDKTVKAESRGSDCAPMLFGISGGTIDVANAKLNTDTGAIIGKIRSTELWDIWFLGFGALCIEVVGENAAPPRRDPDQ